MRPLKIKIAKFASRLMWRLTGKHRQVGEKLPVLCYHRVLPDLVEGETPVFSVTPQQFDEQLSYLARNGFQSLSLSEYFEMAQGKRPIPPRAALITFDDGFADIYSCAWPIAKRYGFKLNVFICTGLICGLKPAVYTRLPPSAHQHQQAWPELWRSLTWEEIRQMKFEGAEIGFHGHSHRPMSALSEEELRDELAIGLRHFELNLGHRPRFFALPHGTYESYNDRDLSLIRESGIELIFTTRLERTRLDPGGFLCSRIVVHQEDDLAAFERKIYGAYDWLGHLLQLSRVISALRKPTRRLEIKSSAGTDRTPENP